MYRQTSRLRDPSEADKKALIKAVRDREQSRVISLLSDESPVIHWPKYFEGATPEDKQFLDECRAKWAGQLEQEGDVGFMLHE